MDTQYESKMLVKVTKADRSKRTSEHVLSAIRKQSKRIDATGIKQRDKKASSDVLDTFFVADNTGERDIGNQNKSLIIQLIKERVKSSDLYSSESGSTSSESDSQIFKDDIEIIPSKHLHKADVTKTDKEMTKSEIVLSILREILVKLESPPVDELTERTILFPSESLPQTLPRMKGRSRKLKQTRHPTFIDQTSLKDEGKLPRLASVIRDLGLPIERCEPKPFEDPRVDLGGIELRTVTVLSSVSEIRRERDIKIRRWDSESVSEQSEREPKSPIELSWCFGFNPEVPVINLSTIDSSMVVFASSNTVVLHDFHDNTMHFMEGHHNKISCLARDFLGLYIVSADCGEENRVIIWDSNTCVVKILENVHPLGTQMVGLSSQGKYLITVTPLPQHIIQMWLWQTDDDEPAVEEYSNEWCGEIKKLTINPYSEEEFALTYESGVTFVYIVNGQDKYSFHIDPHQFPQKLGTFTDTIFLSEQRVAALSSTSMGFVVVWINDPNVHRRKIHEKHVSLHLGPITHIAAVDNLVAVAMGTGNVSFYDSNLTGIYFSRKMQMGEVKSLSFNMCIEKTTQRSTVLTCPSHESCAVTWRQKTTDLFDATLDNNPFSVRPFIVSTKSGQIAYFNSPNDSPKYILYPSAIYTAIDLIPKSHFLCAGTAAGQFILFDTIDHTVKTSYQLQASGDDECRAVACLRYSPSGAQLACGMYSGEIWLLDPLLLKPKPDMPLTDCPAFITHMAFSPEEDFLGVADSSFCVTLFTLEDKPEMVGQFYAHTQPVRDIFFDNNGLDLQMFTLGEDRYLVQFEIPYIDGEPALSFKQVHRMEQTAAPLCMALDPYSTHYIMANSEMKFKLLEYQTLKCCKTIRTPDLGTPITFLEHLPGSNSKYLVFGTSCYLGLQMLPLDGNPYKSMAFRASPTSIISCKIHSNGKYLFTISENSSSIEMWKINTLAVDCFYDDGEQGVDAYLNLLEGGKGGSQEQDLREFFLTAQFMHQGERPSVARSLASSLPVSKIVNVFQAMGFFPTKYQIENILYEVTGKTNYARGTIHFDDLVRLYVNHRPSTELTRADLLDAFNGFYQGVYFSDRDSTYLKLDPETIYDSASFVEKIMVTGEEMSFAEVNIALSILTEGKMELVKEGGSHSLPTLPYMPKELSFNTFVHDILGFPGGKQDDITKLSTLPIRNQSIRSEEQQSEELHLS